MTTVRNPLSALVVTILTALGLTLLVGVPTLFLPYFELQLIILSFAAVGVGAVAGRSSLIGSMGLAGALVGGFFGSFVFVVAVAEPIFFWPTVGLELFIALWLGALCGLGGLLTGKLGLRRIEKAVQAMPQQRRCGRCGAKVGLNATKCWSCRAYLPQN